jgi:hypothetical protein
VQIDERPFQRWSHSIGLDAALFEACGTDHGVLQDIAIAVNNPQHKQHKQHKSWYA